MAMAKNVQRARHEAGLTQAELAERVHHRQAAISQLERGQMILDVETLVYLAGVLEKPIRWLFPDRLLPLPEGELPNWQRHYLENIRNLTPVDQRRVAEYVDLLARVREYEEREIKQRIRDQLDELGPLPESDNYSLPTPPQSSADDPSSSSTA
jgi:transcriptional regulator with XRE-family HTH domain